MATKHVSLRMDAEVFRRLERRIQQVGGRRPDLITRYVDEGLRIDEHPGIVFRPGPAGRRPALVGGPDVWEVIRVIRNVEATGEAAVDAAATWLGLRRDQVEAALRYYSDYASEIDEWISRVDDEATHLHEAWVRRQRTLA
jgi:uncharacterized protein (DUF433 family)